MCLVPVFKFKKFDFEPIGVGLIIRAFTTLNPYDREKRKSSNVLVILIVRGRMNLWPYVVLNFIFNIWHGTRELRIIIESKRCTSIQVICMSVTVMLQEFDFNVANSAQEVVYFYNPVITSNSSLQSIEHHSGKINLIISFVYLIIIFAMFRTVS